MVGTHLRVYPRPIQAVDGSVKRRLPIAKLPPPFLSPYLPVDLHSFRLDPLLDNRHQVRPASAALSFTSVSEVDHVAVVGVSRACVDFLAADVGVDDFTVARVGLEESLHLGER